MDEIDAHLALVSVVLAAVVVVVVLVVGQAVYGGLLFYLLVEVWPSPRLEVGKEAPTCCTVC